MLSSFNRPRSTGHPFVDNDQVHSELVPAEKPFVAQGTRIPRQYATLEQVSAEVGLAVHAPVEPAAQVWAVRRVLVAVAVAVHAALAAEEEPVLEGIYEHKCRCTRCTGGTLMKTKSDAIGVG